MKQQKKFFFLALMAISVWIFSACNMAAKGGDSSPADSAPVSGDNSIESNFTITEEDHSGGYQYPTGIYYDYQFREAVATTPKPEALLGKLIEAGIPINKAWYRAGSNHCRAPGSQIAMTVIVPTRFFVHLDQPDSRLTEMGYQQTQITSIQCGFSVKQYTKK